MTIRFIILCLTLSLACANTVQARKSSADIRVLNQEAISLSPHTDGSLPIALAVGPKGPISLTLRPSPGLTLISDQQLSLTPENGRASFTAEVSGAAPGRYYLMIHAIAADGRTRVTGAAVQVGAQAVTQKLGEAPEAIYLQAEETVY